MNARAANPARFSCDTTAPPFSAGVRVALLLLALLVPASWAGAQSTMQTIGKSLLGSKEPRLVVVFVDLTSSVQDEDWKIYRESFYSLVDTVGPGDRVVLGTITEETAAGYKAVREFAVKTTGNSVTDKEQARHAREDLNDAFRRLRKAGTKADSTRILDTLLVADEIFKRDTAHSRKLLVLLSDMVEQSSDANFVKVKLTKTETEKIIQSRKNRKLFPDLKGVEVYVAGAGAAPEMKAQDRTAKMQEIKTFWIAYLTAAGATVEDSRYGRSSLRFE